MTAHPRLRRPGHGLRKSRRRIPRTCRTASIAQSAGSLSSTKVLLVGVAYDADTTVHLAENLADVRYRRPKYATVLKCGQPTRYDYGEVDHCCQNFNLLDQWLDPEGRQRRGVVGHAEARLGRSRDIVEAALARLRVNEAVFLHAPGLCGECDEARASFSAGLERA